MAPAQIDQLISVRFIFVRLTRNSNELSRDETPRCMHGDSLELVLPRPWLNQVRLGTSRWESNSSCVFHSGHVLQVPQKYNGRQH